jgi:hypothetical protein
VVADQAGPRVRGEQDKWFALVEDDRRYLHRSWTGFGGDQAIQRYAGRRRRATDPTTSDQPAARQVTAGRPPVPVGARPMGNASADEL